MSIVFVGIDLAKNVFAVHGVNEAGKPALVKPSVARGKLLELVASLAPCTIGLEACSGAHHWARQFTAHGHTVRLMAPKFVAPYRLSGKQGKNDAADAAAICEAVQRPNMRFVPIKNLSQQGQLGIHRVRQGFIEQRTATINRIRGLLAEFGIVLPLKASTVRREATGCLEDLPGWANTAVGDLLSELHHLDERIGQYDKHIAQMAREDSRAQQLMRLKGIGETTASAMLAMIGNGHEFKCGRQFAAWLGLAPSQYSSGGKARLGHITKAGDRYMRSLLVLGARSVLNRAKEQTDSLSRWALALAERRGYWRAIVAIAAKNARMAWAMLARGERFAMPA
ncbi:MAG: IS110 family transposase [Polaromonas sp.]|nr:IS110 family transposase [Polaromonas sp.]